MMAGIYPWHPVTGADKSRGLKCLLEYSLLGGLRNSLVWGHGKSIHFRYQCL